MSELKRDLGLWSAAAIVVGTVIGSGIFIVPKSMVLNVGTPGMVLFVLARVFREGARLAEEVEGTV